MENYKTYVLKKELPDGSLPGRLFSNSISDKPTVFFGHHGRVKESKSGFLEIPEHIIKESPDFFVEKRTGLGSEFTIQRKIEIDGIQFLAGVHILRRTPNHFYFAFPFKHSVIMPMLFLTEGQVQLLEENGDITTYRDPVLNEDVSINYLLTLGYEIKKGNKSFGTGMVINSR